MKVFFLYFIVFLHGRFSRLDICLNTHSGNKRQDKCIHCRVVTIVCHNAVRLIPPYLDENLIFFLHSNERNVGIVSLGLVVVRYLTIFLQFNILFQCQFILWQLSLKNYALLLYFKHMEDLMRNIVSTICQRVFFVLRIYVINKYI